MSNLTRITANFAVASAQRDSIAPTYSNDMGRLILETWIDPMVQDEQTVLLKPVMLVLGLTYLNARSQDRQSRSSEANQEFRSLYQQEVMMLNEGRERIANDTNIEAQSAIIGDICTFSSMFEDVDFSWFDSGLLDLTVGTSGNMTSCDTRVTAHDKTNDNADSTLTNNRYLGSLFRSRSEAYQRCAWTSWHPSRFQHSFHGQDVINLGAGNSRERTTLLMKASTGRRMGSTLDDACRDHLLVLVTAMKISHFSIHSFPPAELLNDLVRFFFVQESASLVPSIHPSTFSCFHARPELLLGIIAAGAVIVPERRIQVTGLVMHEILRAAMAQLYESDNSTTRDLQALQAYLRALEVGAWSGLKRKTEIACSFMQPGYTMLFQAGAFSSPSEQELAGGLDQGTQKLDTVWKSWAMRESLKRLAIRAFIHDSQVSMAYFQAPTISYAELNMAVPYPPSLWFAEGSKEWRQDFLLCNSGSRRLLLTEVLADVTVLETCSGEADLQLCCFAAIHALANQVWDLQQQFALLFAAPEAKRRRTDSWCMSRQRDLYHDLMTIRMYCERHVAHHEISFLLEYVMMTLHTPMAYMQRFAGKEGESEARRVAPVVSEWGQSSAARVAIWHAGQVLRRAREFPPTALQNFYAVATYHAALVLWTYSILGNRSPTQAEIVISDGINRNGSTDNSSMTLVMLDGEENDDARAFCILGHGTPGLSHPAYTGVKGTFCTLADPVLIMQLAADTLRGNLLSTDHAPPLLVGNLIGLMEDLGSSLGHSSPGRSSRTSTTGSTG
ncbi:C6 transcription factor [Fusarium oxysporum f. sp. phaseoli]